MKGSLSHELEVAVPAGEVWEVYSSLKLADITVKLMPDVLTNLDIEGDGGVGTVLTFTLAPGIFPGVTHYKEKFVKVDHEKRLKEAAIIEGGYLALGFTSYSVRFEVIEKSNDTSVIKSSIEYEIDEELKAHASFVTTASLEAIAAAVSSSLLEKKAKSV